MSNADVPVVILAGGRGARFDHESEVCPKPMIHVAGKPILQHIIDSLTRQGFREFIVLTGHLHERIEAHFETYSLLVNPCDTAPWLYRCDSVGREVTVRTVFTGVDSHTGLRLWHARRPIGGRRFVLTYGDGLCDVDMAAVLEQHERTGADVTLTAVRPPGRFGVIEFEEGESTLCELEEHVAIGWINGGFMVMEPQFIEQYIEGEFELESTALRELGASAGLHAYRHYGFWMCMDTRRDREQIERAVQMNDGKLPWIR
jgi:glucose-1-phosphate cytidylyltransferase